MQNTTKTALVATANSLSTFVCIQLGAFSIRRNIPSTDKFAEYYAPILVLKVSAISAALIMPLAAGCCYLALKRNYVLATKAMLSTLIVCASIVSTYSSALLYMALNGKTLDDDTIGKANLFAYDALLGILPGYTLGILAYMLVIYLRTSTITKHPLFIAGRNTLLATIYSIPSIALGALPCDSNAYSYKKDRKSVV